MKKILLAYDGSRQADKAFAWGLDFAEKYEARLIILSIVEMPTIPDDADLQILNELMTGTKREFHQAHAILKEQAEQRGIAAAFEVEAGHPAEKILAYAGKCNADMVLVGHRGRSAFKQWLLGSVAKKVVDHATCAVTIVR